MPVVYTVRPDGESPVRHALDDELLREFINSAIDKYHGLTQANPLAPALYKGWWSSRPGDAVHVDYLTV